MSVIMKTAKPRAVTTDPHSNCPQSRADCVRITAPNSNLSILPLIRHHSNPCGSCDNQLHFTDEETEDQRS